MEAKSTVMATQNVVHFPTEYHDAPFFEPRDVPDIHYIKDKLRRIDPAANICIALTLNNQLIAPRKGIGRNVVCNFRNI